MLRDLNGVEEAVEVENELGSEMASGGEPSGLSADPGVKREGEFPRPDELWHTPAKEPWATIRGQHYPVQSELLRQWLTGKLFELDGKPPSKSALDKVIMSFAAEAQFNGLEHPVYLRRAQDHLGIVWLDLADKTGRAVRISRDEWCVVPGSQVPVRFARPSNMRALPVPLREEADVSLLAELLNVPDEVTLKLVTTWLSFAMLPEQPYPVLAVSGPPGSAKSTLSEFVRELIDPSEVPLVGLPRGTDLVACAKNNAVLCLDNLSAITPWLADDLCRLASGGGFGGRKLYTNDGDATFRASRPIILNGISDLATRGDLADRTLLIHVPKMPDGRRRMAAEMREAFEYAHPRILAGLLDMVVLGLRRKPDVLAQRRALPRMADFAVWGYAVAPALGWTEDDFGLAYRANRGCAFDAAIDNDPIAPLILSLLEKRREWQGTTTQLLEVLKHRAGSAGFAPTFPRSPEGLGKMLNRIEPALAARGVTMERSRPRQGSVITLRNTG